jgi:GT2 family glycosyltransferase
MTADGGDGAEPRLSVVLSTLGNYDVLRRVLDGYSAQDAVPGSFEMIVVSDRADPHPERVDAAIGSRPFTARRVTGRIPGLSANRNTGVAEARAPIVLITDNDTIPCRGLVSEHLRWHERHPEEEVVVTGHIRWAPELKKTAFMRWLDHGVQFDFPSVKGVEAEWAHVYGANASIKRSFIERVGGWDEERLPYLYDDLDWSYRASRQGLRVLYNRGAVVDHVRYDANLEFWKQKMDRLARAEHQFTLIHPEITPWFFGKFRSAAALPPLRGRAARLASFVPQWVPVLGPRVWKLASLYWRQQLAPYFLEAWEDASRSPGSHPAGSVPGGPK